MGIHDEKGSEMADQASKEKSQEALRAIDVILSQFQAIHSGQSTRDAASKARKNARVVYNFVKGKENRKAQGVFPPHEVKAMAVGLGKNPEETVEKYVKHLLSLKKQIKA
jgi:Holliday junction resolvasome RuvABC endonuclease subunit